MAAPLRTGTCLLLCFQLINIFINGALAWVQEELELFDLVEEIKENFYDILKVDQSASSGDIRRAYRQLSLQLHPDKNKEDNAEEIFRRLVAVYEVLKDENKRLRYNEILRNGLPDWRQPVFYYRRMRKMTLWEMLIFLLLLLTSGQYLLMWAAYWEKKYELEELLTSKKKRTEKKLRKQKIQLVESTTEDMFQEEFNSLPRPQLVNLLICLLVKFLLYKIKDIPSYIVALREALKSSPPVEATEEEEKVLKRPKKKVQLPEDIIPAMAEDLTPISNLGYTLIAEGTSDKKQLTDRMGLDWDDEDLSQLAKAMSKFPGGTPQRWEKISDLLGRSVNEVTDMAKKVKGSSYDMSSIISKESKTDGFLQVNDEDATVKRYRPTKIIKTAERTLMISQQDFSANKENTSDTWSRYQQRFLEQALIQYPKGTPDRWDVIAKDVPGKTKEECISRYKELVELIKQKKQGSS